MAASPEPRLRLVPSPGGEGHAQGASRPAYSAAAAAAMAPATTGTGPANSAETGPANTTAPPGANDTVGANDTNDTAGATTGTPEPAAAATPAECPAPPVIEPFGRPMTAGERVGRVARHWLHHTWAGTVEASRDPAKAACRAFWHAGREPIGEWRAYVAGRTWLPDGHEGALLPALGVIDHYTIGALLVGLGRACAFLGNALEFLGKRPVRRYIAIVIAAGCWLGLHFGGHVL